jgi:hypothetical protein
MNLTRAVGFCAALLLTTPVICAAEQVQEGVTVAQFAVQGVLSRIQTYADVCTAKIPSLAADFQKLMRELNARVDRIAKPLLASYATDPTVQGATPKALIDAYNNWNHDLHQQLAGIDAAKECPKYLTNYRNTSDEFFRSGLSHTLASLKQEVEELEKH